MKPPDPHVMRFWPKMPFADNQTPGNWVSFRTALKEARELNDELKEIVGEKAESTQEYACLISSQRQEIENPRKIISENNLEV